MLSPRRRPTEPGEILREHYLKARSITIVAFAEAVGCTRKHISNILHGRARIEPEMAARFSAVLGTTPQLWLNLQTNVDLYDALQKIRRWKPKHTFHGVEAHP